MEASSTVAQHEVVSLPIFMCENHIYQHATTTSSTLLRSTCPPFAPGILSISQRLPSQECSFLHVYNFISHLQVNHPLNFPKSTFISPVSSQASRSKPRNIRLHVWLGFARTRFLDTAKDRKFSFPHPRTSLPHSFQRDVNDGLAILHGPSSSGYVPPWTSK